MIRPNSFVLAGDERHLVAQRLTRNQQVVLANRPANGFHLRTKSPGKSGIFFVECKLMDRSGKKAGEELSVHFAAQAL